MATLTRTLQKNNWLIYTALLLTLIVLLIVSPAEATLGNVVKIVYAHGAAQRIATYAYIIAGGLGLVHLALRGALRRSNPPSSWEDVLARWTHAIAETAIVFWFIQFVVSAPAQVLAWGAFDFNEPRVAGALWILVFTALVYIVACWIGEVNWISLAAIVNAAILFIVLRGAVNILHPIDPIITSDSLAIKGFYAAIVVTMGLLAFQFARDRAKE